ncbi:MAG: 3'-5' exonuclease [Bacteroidota bacterium]
MKYIVLDLEATCWEKKGKQRKSEIIEIGAVAIDEVGNSVGEFSAFVKPLRHPELSDFCKSLTSIKQEDVDTAKVFPEVLQDFQDWI